MITTGGGGATEDVVDIAAVVDCSIVEVVDWSVVEEEPVVLGDGLSPAVSVITSCIKSFAMMGSNGGMFKAALELEDDELEVSVESPPGGGPPPGDPVGSPPGGGPPPPPPGGPPPPPGGNGPPPPPSVVVVAGEFV